MTITRFKLLPGIFDSVTSKDALNRYIAGTNERFWKGYPQKKGGAAKFTTASFAGMCRGLMQWTSLTSNQFIAVGTSYHLYVEEGGTFYNITPAASSGTLGADPFAVTNGSNSVVVTAASHNVAANYFVSFSGATSFNNISINGEYQVVSVTNSNAFVITANSNANGNASGGGNNVAYVFEIPPGNNDAISLYGWGAGTWSTPRKTAVMANNPFTSTNGSTTVQVTYTGHGFSAGTDVSFENASAFNNITINGDYTIAAVTNANSFNITANTNANANGSGGGANVTMGWNGWSTQADSNGVVQIIRTWSLDKWGEDLLANPRDGGLYQWDVTNGLSTRAVAVTNAPSAIKCILVHPDARITSAYGCTDLATGVQDPLLIRWCSQEELDIWDPSTILTPLGNLNTSGDHRLTSGNEIKQSIYTTTGDIIVLTDTSATLQFLTGDNNVFGFKNLGSGCGGISPNCMVQIRGIVYWMSQSGFFTYDGVVRKMRCDVQRTVFDSLNSFQSAKVYGGIISQYSEAIWCYPSADSTENDRVVAYNWEEDVWWTGQLVRTALIDSGAASTQPLSTNANGYLLQEEVGTDDVDQAMPTSLTSYGFMNGDGDNFLHCRRIIPDFQYFSGSMDVSVGTKAYPDSSTTTTKGPFPITGTTQKVSMRSRGRLSTVTWNSNALGADHRFGDTLLDVLTDGRRQ